MNIIIFLSSLILFTMPGLLLTLPFGIKKRIQYHPDFIFIGYTIGMLLSCLIAALVGFFFWIPSSDSNCDLNFNIRYYIFIQNTKIFATAKINGAS